ncbi:MAG: phage tail protein [Actinobacteria bacterium HGW-Actinobacteria-6]|nr:MAG: phage tail protein [Actinobacteria bacterium HGW-Actinobacteria-6]
MTEPFLSEIRIMSFNFAPRGWAFCNGQILPINQNQALYSLLGTTYGGDGRVNFALPNLQGSTPIHMGSGHTLGERSGEQAHTLSAAEVDHAHDATVSTSGADRAEPTDSVWAVASAAVYGDSANSAMASGLVGTVGGSQAHLNMQPFLTLNFSIALQGIFPSQY